MTMLREWDYKQVQDFDHLAYLWDSFSRDEELACENIGQTLRTRLGLPIIDMTADQSAFFKHHYKAVHRNMGTTMTELDVIRRVERW